MKSLITKITIYETKIKEIFFSNKFYIFFFLAIFFSTSILKLYNIHIQGFGDSDIFAHHEFLLRYFSEYKLEGTMGSMWGRPSRTFLQFLISYFFGFTTLVYNLSAVISGILLTLIIFLFCKKYFNKLTAFYVLIFCSFSFSFFYWSRIAKFIIPSIIILILSISVAFKIIKNYENKNSFDLFILGLLLSLSVTFHPNTLPTVLSIGSFFFIKEASNFFRKKTFDFYSLSYIFFGFISVVFFYEIIFIYFKYSSNWLVYDNVSWIAEIFKHSSMIDKSRGGILYYSNIISQEGVFFSLLILIGSISLIKNFSNLNETHYFLIYVLVITFFLYLFSGVNPRLRNIFQLFIILIILSSYGISILSFRFKFLIINILFIFVIINFFVNHWNYLQNFKNIEIVNKNFGGIENIAMIKSNKTTYHFEKYYYNKFYSNWQDIWSGYFCDDVAFLSIPPGLNINKLGKEGLIFEKYYLPNDIKGKSNFKIINLNENIPFFKDFFQIRMIKKEKNFNEIKFSDLNFKNEKIFLIFEGNIISNKNDRNQISIDFFKDNELIYSEKIFPDNQVINNNVKKVYYDGNFFKKTFILANQKNLGKLTLKLSKKIGNSDEFDLKVVALKFINNISLDSCRKL